MMSISESSPVIQELSCDQKPWDWSSEKATKHRGASTKIFNDPVHGQITLHPACVAVIDTSQFQRLRRIKQTGFTETVYHGSSHNRFGHSLGVCYLAGKFLRELREQQPELQLSDTDILCVELAGLCHDLGHGPYSHTWEIFMKDSSSKRNKKGRWKHERVSANVFDYLVEDNDLYPVLQKYGIGSDELALVKDYILGGKPKDKSKAYLYQVINNEVSGLDVDKFDYFLRDSLHLGLPCSFGYERILRHAKVFFVDNQTQICFRDKTMESVYNAFRTRSNLHRIAYQHKCSIITEKMFIDAVIMADDKVIGIDGEVQHFWEWSMSAAYGHGEKLKSALEKFCMLTDDMVYSLLKFTPLPDLKKASELIKTLDRRSCKNDGFYQHACLKILDYHLSEEKIHQGICDFLPVIHRKILRKYDIWQHKDIRSVEPSDICVCVVFVNWGKGAKNPVEFVHFYTKDNMDCKKYIAQHDLSVMPPKSYEEIHVHVLSRRSDKFALDVIQSCCISFWEYHAIMRDEGCRIGDDMWFRCMNRDKYMS